MKYKRKCQKKTKKKILKLGILEQKIFHICIFFEKNSRNFQNSLIKSLILQIKHYKKFNNFLSSLDRWNRKRRCKKC